MRPAFLVVVEFDLGAIFGVDLVELALPFDTLAELVEHFTHTVAGNVEGFGGAVALASHCLTIDGEGCEQAARNIGQAMPEAFKNLVNAFWVKP